MTLRHLINDWRSRLLRSRARAADPQDHDPWLWRIRERVLTYLVERYTFISDHPVPRTATTTTRDELGWGPLPVSPPRPAPNLRGLLLDLRAANERARARLRSWRWW